MTTATVEPIFEPRVASCVASSELGCCHLEDATLRGGVASPSPLPSVRGEGEEGTQHPATDGVVRTQHPQARNTSLYVSPTLLVFEEPHDQDGTCPLAPDFTHTETTPEADLVWPFRRLDPAWLGWLARVVGRAGDRLSPRQRAAWDQVQAWAREHDVRPTSPPPGYRPPVAFRGSMWRYDRDRTDGKGIATGLAR